MLGSSAPGAILPTGFKGARLLECPARARPTQRACNAHHARPLFGAPCGRRERGSRHDAGWSDPPARIVLATVKGTWSSEWRRPSRGAAGTSASAGPLRARRSPPRRCDAPATTGALWAAEEGNVVCARHQSARTRRGGLQRLRGSLGTRPSLGPGTRARRTWLNPPAKAVGCHAVGQASGSGKPAQAGGTGLGARRIGRTRGSPRVTASLVEGLA